MSHAVHGYEGHQASGGTEARNGGKTCCLLPLPRAFSPRIDFLNYFIVVVANAHVPQITHYRLHCMARHTDSPQGKSHIPQRKSIGLSWPPAAPIRSKGLISYQQGPKAMKNKYSFQGFHLRLWIQGTWGRGGGAVMS